MVELAKLFLHHGMPVAVPTLLASTADFSSAVAGLAAANPSSFHHLPPPTSQIQILDPSPSNSYNTPSPSQIHLSGGTPQQPEARDLYVQSLTGCAGHLPGDAAFGYPSFAAAPLPRADSFTSSRRFGVYDDDDLRELIRAASQRRAAEAAAATAEPVTVPWSQSVAMARIDEDRPCEFADAGAGVAFPRSRSCAAGSMDGGEGRGSVLSPTIAQSPPPLFPLYNLQLDPPQAPFSELERIEESV